ncbi:hypothetical protein VPH35_075001 [Triticum aestivum]
MMLVGLLALAGGALLCIDMAGGPAGSVPSTITRGMFDSMLGDRNLSEWEGGAFYTYDAFLEAANASVLGGFGTTGEDATRRRELAGFFGQTSFVTTSYCYVKAVNRASAPYYGRGPIQLTTRRRKQAEIREEAMENWWEEGNFFDVDQAMEDDPEKGCVPKRFRYGDLDVATDNFCDKNKLGEGGFGSMYRGFLDELNLQVAIKRVSKGSKQQRKEYASEVKVISRLQHKNLVQLIGWCHEGGDLLLIYKLMPNGILDGHLYGANNIVLPLFVRYDWDKCILHRDINPSNIMLDSSFKAKLRDFGLAKLVQHDRGSLTTDFAGTMGYMDLECMTTGKTNPESDVYSFGVVLLETACDRRHVVVAQREEDTVHLAQWVWDLYGKGRILDATDERLGGEFDAQEMKRLDFKMRPSIRQAVNVLRSEAPLPSLPVLMPVAYYMSPVGTRSFSSLSVTTGSNNGTSTSFVS